MQIVDRRQNPKGKSLTNRQRFITRARSRLREAIRQRIAERSIADTGSGETVVIPADDTHEPEFRHDTATGTRTRVLPGNRSFRAGDELPRPPRGRGGGGGRKGSRKGEGEDSFAFTLTREEFLDLLFEDLRLPDMVQKTLKAQDSNRARRAGYSLSGPHARLNLVRSLRGSIMRRAALGRPKRAAVAAMEEELAQLESGEIAPADGRPAKARMAELQELLAKARGRRAVVPFLDPMDLRYNRMESRPEPIAQAVMFCLMDVSASMDEEMKGLAKRFFLLLHLFLERHYDNVEVVFIRHTQRAEEVDEETFFRSRETGGTLVSSALKEMLRIASARYPQTEYNIYVAQASDGDDSPGDVETCVELLRDRVLPLAQYMAYVEIDPQNRIRAGFSTERTSDLWRGYATVSEANPKLAMRHIAEAGDIFPVFRDLFRSEGVST